LTFFFLICKLQAEGRDFMYKIVKKINPNIFRGYDIRGVMDED